MSVLSWVSWMAGGGGGGGGDVDPEDELFPPPHAGAISKEIAASPAKAMRQGVMTGTWMHSESHR